MKQVKQQAMKPIMSSEQLPLTPPSTVKKETYQGKGYQHTVKPKLLLASLKKNNNDKIKYNWRKLKPKLNSIYDIDYLVEKPSDSRNFQFLQSVLQNCKNIVIVSGAGISTHAGIPDFRSTSGLYANGNVDKSTLDITSIYSTEERTAGFNKLITSLYDMALTKEPTPFHRLINQMAIEGRLKRVYTQNIDSLETKLSNLNTTVPLSDCVPKQYPILIQLHGSILDTQCTKCNNIADFDKARFPIDINSDVDMIPSCLQCEEFESVREVAGLRSKGVGFVRPRITLYNEPHLEGEVIADVINSDLKTRKNAIDCLLIVGTTLQIPGVKQLCQNFAKVLRKRKSGPVIFVSNELPSKSIINLVNGFDMIVHGDCQNLVQFI